MDDRERARALELVAGCDECSALYADLGAIAEATSALPARPRPRDFALTEEDAARLRPRRGGWARLLGIVRRRSFGGALVALGFSGLVLTSALSMLGTAPTLMSSNGRYAAAPAVGAASSSNAYSQGAARSRSRRPRLLRTRRSRPPPRRRAESRAARWPPLPRPRRRRRSRRNRRPFSTRPRRPRLRLWPRAGLRRTHSGRAS